MTTERNQGFRDGLEGRGNPSNGDWNAWRQGDLARQERASFAELSKWNNPPAPSPPRVGGGGSSMSDDDADVLVSIFAVLLAVMFIVIVFMLTAFLLVGVFAVRGGLHLAGLVRHVERRWAVTATERLVDPAARFMVKVEAWVSAIPKRLLGGFIYFKD